jgi:hypothetical protein
VAEEAIFLTLAHRAETNPDLKARSYGTRALPRGSSGALQFLCWWAAALSDRLIPSLTSPLLSSALAILPGEMSVQL